MQPPTTITGFVAVITDKYPESKHAVTVTPAFTFLNEEQK